MKNVYFILLGIALAVILWLLLQPGCNRTVVANPLSDSVTYWKTRYGKEVASQRGTQEQFAIQNGKLMDSIAKIYNTKTKNIQGFTIATVQGHTDLSVVPGTQASDYFPPAHDSCPPQIRNMRQEFASTWYKAKVQLGEQSYLHLDSYDTVTTLTKIIKTGNIFHRKSLLQIDVSLADTSRHVTGMKSYQRLKVPKEISLNAEAEILYYNKEFNPFVGMGIQRSAARYDVGITGGKNLADKQWFGKAYFKLKLLKF